MTSTEITINTITESGAEFKLDQIESVVESVLGIVKNSSKNIVTLKGDLGAGKTTLVKSIAKRLGIEETVNSPTFTILKSYKINAMRVGHFDSSNTLDFLNERFENLIHIDAYRLDDPEELGALKLEGYFSNPKNLVFIEWPEKLANILPGSTIQIQLEAVEETDGGSDSQVGVDKENIRKIKISV